MNEQDRPLPYPEDRELPFSLELRAYPISGEPVDVEDQINKYGTYEVQDTTDTDNVFPTIGPHNGWKACLDLPDIRKGKKKTEP